MPTSCSTRKQGRTIASDPSRGGARQRSLYRLIRQFFFPRWTWFLGGTLFAVLTSLAAASYGLLIKYVGDGLQYAVDPDPELATSGGLQQLIPFDAGDGSVGSWVLWAAGAIVVAAILRAISLYAMTLLNNTGVQTALVDVQQAQYDALVSGDYARVAGAASGSFVSRFINDVTAMRDAGLRLANNLTKGVVTVIAGLAGMLYMDWQLALVLLIAYPIAFGPVIALGNSIRRRAKRAQEQVGEVTALLSEGFQQARVVKAYGLEAYQARRAGQGFLTRAKLFLKVLRDKAAVDPILEVAGGVAIAGVFGLSAFRIATGAATLGDLLGFIALIGIIAPEIRALGTLNAVAQEGAAAADRVYDIIEQDAVVRDGTGTKQGARSDGHLVVSDVSFAYGTEPVLQGISLEARPGETIALVGPSGSGKSTLFNLLLRLYDPSGGDIRIDDKLLNAMTLQDLRSRFALVSQDTALFDDSIAENIRLGREGASDEDVRRAADAAHVTAFADQLPGGLDTPVGEGGRALSGGQRQRVAIARALLRDAPFLLLDEATSALDSESEALIQDALADLSRGRTTIVIAHRLSTIRHADRIFVFDAGRVVESGSHEDLLGRDGAYARLVRRQD